MSKALHLIALGLALALVAACGGGGGASPTDTPAAATTPSPNATPLAPGAALTPSAETDAAVQGVKDDLMRRLAVTSSDIDLVSINAQDWPDACLGAGEADETCATVITPGYEIVVRVNESSYTYRTDTGGSNVRFAGIHTDAGN
jgi:hypothetical protein